MGKKEIECKMKHSCRLYKVKHVNIEYVLMEDKEIVLLFYKDGVINPIKKSWIYESWLFAIEGNDDTFPKTNFSKIGIEILLTSEIPSFREWAREKLNIK